MENAKVKAEIVTSITGDAVLGGQYNLSPTITTEEKATVELESKALMTNPNELSFDICKLYAKGSCKKCYGRGYQKYDSGKNTINNVDYCSCVRKALGKLL